MTSRSVQLVTGTVKGLGGNDQAPVSPTNPLPVAIQNNPAELPYNWQSAGPAEQITGLSTAKTPASVPVGAVIGVVMCSSQPVRYKDDGGTPDATHGLTLQPGQPLTVSLTLLTAIKFIETAASATIDILYYK